MSKLLTDATIRGVEPPSDGRRIEIADRACLGLVLRVTSGNIKSFGFRFRDRSTRRCERAHIGRYPDVSLREARLKADELRREVAAGRNPNSVRREATDRTFGALAERFLIEHSRRKKKSSHLDEGMLKNHILPHWRHRDFTTIERADVIRLVERIVTAGKGTMANRVQALVSGIFSFGMDAGLVKANPVSRMRRRAEERRKSRVLSDPEIRLFWSRSALPPVSPVIGLALRTILATGARPGEVAAMARASLEIGRDGVPTAWLIPAERSKNGKPHLVPLSPLARDLITEAMKLSGNSPFVFAGRYSGGNGVTGHATAHAISVAMSRMVRNLPEGQPGVDTWRADAPTPHDLRRTCATRLSAAGVVSDVVSAVLNHAPRTITARHYDMHERIGEKRAALDRWSGILSAILQGRPAHNVIALRS